MPDASNQPDQPILAPSLREDPDYLRMAAEEQVEHKRQLFGGRDPQTIPTAEYQELISSPSNYKYHDNLDQKLEQRFAEAHPEKAQAYKLAEGSGLHPDSHLPQQAGSAGAEGIKIGTGSQASVSSMPAEASTGSDHSSSSTPKADGEAGEEGMDLDEYHRQREDFTDEHDPEHQTQEQREEWERQKQDYEDLNDPQKQQEEQHADWEKKKKELDEHGDPEHKEKKPGDEQKPQQEEPGQSNAGGTPQSDFADATPDYVAKQPNQPKATPASDFPQNNPNQVVGPGTVKPTQRLSADQLSGHTHNVPINNVANAGKQIGQTAGKVASKANNEIPIAAQVGTALSDLKELKNAEGIKGKAAALKGAAEDVAATVAEGAIDATGVGAVVMAGLNLVLSKEDKRDIIAAASGDPLAVGKSAWKIGKRHYKLVLYPGILEAIFAFFLGMALSAILSSLLGNTPGGIGIPGQGTYVATKANPDGLYLDIMAETITLPDPVTKKTGPTLTLEATSGGYSDETAARMATTANATGVTGDRGESIIGKACLYNTKTGAWRDENTGHDHDTTTGVDCLSMSKVFDQTTGKTRPATDDELKWYVTARWPYVKTYWPGTNKASTVGNPSEPFKYFQGIDVVLYNPLTNKAVHGKAFEWGPSVKVGIDDEELGNTKTSWMYGPFGPQPRIQIPENYPGRVAGGGPAIRDYLGEGSDGPIIVGYLKPGVNLPLGPIDAKAFKVIKRGVDATSAQAGKVPLIKQGQFAKVLYSATGDPKQTVASSGCGVVSAAMVLMFYGKTVTVPELAAWSVANGYRTADSGTSHGFFPAIAQREGLKAEEVTGNWDRITQLLKAGTPVIISGQAPKGTADPRPFVAVTDKSPHASHFVVMTGMTADGRITVNDPAGSHPAGLSRDGQSYSLDTFKSFAHYAVAILK